MPYSVSLTTGSTSNPDPQLGNSWATYLKRRKAVGIELHPTFLSPYEEKALPDHSQSQLLPQARNLMRTAVAR